MIKIYRKYPVGGLNLDVFSPKAKEKFKDYQNIFSLQLYNLSVSIEEGRAPEKKIDEISVNAVSSAFSNIFFKESQKQKSRLMSIMSYVCSAILGIGTSYIHTVLGFFCLLLGLFLGCALILLSKSNM